MVKFKYCVKVKILLIQPDCRSYRVKLFEELTLSYESFYLLHFGNDIGNENIRSYKGNYFKFSFNRIHWIAKLHKIIKEFDVIIVGFDPHWINLFFSAFYYNKKIIYWGHGTGNSRIIRVIRGFLAKRAKSLITYDLNGKSELMGLGVDPNKIFVAHNTQYVPNHEDLSGNAKDLFLFTGRIQKRKALEEVLEAFALVRKLLPKDVKIVIIGDGRFIDELKLKSKILNLENETKFLSGTTDDTILKEYFAKAYAYVSPGHVGLGVLHSFAYGVPVITYSGRNHAPEFSNIENDINGYIVQPNVKSLASALIKITQSNHYRILGSKAYEHFINKRTISNMINAFKAAIEYDKSKNIN